MGLNDIRVSRSLIMSTVAICAAVGICVGILLFLQPWPESRSEAVVAAASSYGKRERADLRAQAFSSERWPGESGPSERIAAPGASPLNSAPRETAPRETAAAAEPAETSELPEVNKACGPGDTSVQRRRGSHDYRRDAETVGSDGQGGDGRGLEAAAGL